MWANTPSASGPAFNFQGQRLPPPHAPSPYPNSLVLTELHTNFPALLYDANRFTNTQSVLRYIQTQMRSQYDIYSSWQNYYMEQQRQRDIQERERQARERHARNRHAYRPPTTWTPHVSQANTSTFDLSYLAAQTLLSDPVTQLMMQGLPATTGFRVSADFMEPVRVTPSVMDLSNASVVFTTDTGLGISCAVCQDEMAAGSQVRRITRCNHTFHKACIDVWFNRDVHCPICRHDVRDTTPLPQVQPRDA